MAAEDLLDGYDEELGVGGAQERDWKGIGTALCVIMMICLMIGMALVLFTPLTATSHILPKRMNMTDIRTLRYPFAEFAFSDKSDNIVTMQSWEGVELIENGSHHVVFTRENGNEIFPTSGLKYFALIDKSPNAGLNPNNVSSFVKIVNDETRMTYDIGLNKEESVLQAFAWNNDNIDFAFVENNKLYYQKSPESTDIVRVSQGNSSTVDGIFDWTYEEEVFGKREALWWSPNGDYLAFASFDNHMVKNVSLKSYYKLAQYPIVTHLAYPKTFAKSLPTYTLSIWDKNTEQTKQMDVQLKDSLSYHYLFSVSWLKIGGSDKLVSVWANRHQNKISLTICDFDSATCQLRFEYSYKPKQWAMPDDFSTMMAHGDSIFFILPHDVKENSYQHIARLKLTTSSPILDFLPTGEVEVLSIDGINSETNKLYFHAAAPEPYQRSLYSIDLSSTNKDSAQCATCQISNCTYSQSTISGDFGKAIVMCKGPEAPRAVILDLTASPPPTLPPARPPIPRPAAPLTPENWQSNAIPTSNYTNYRDLIEDQSFQIKVEEAGLPVIIHSTIKINDDYEALIKLSIPQEMYTKDRMKSIPLLVHVYGGPNDQNTKDQTRIGIEEYISTNQQIGILRIDGRGSGGRGWKYRSPIYGQLGTVEVEDQVAVIKSVLREYHMFDSTRVAVFGWSYGGFMTLRMIEEAPEQFFKCGISVAPVTNFAYYDATYTERFMGDAPIEAYVDATRKLDNFKTTRLLLMHGLSDDNVHFQNSAVLIEELQNRGIDFDMMIYPNQAHSIASKVNHLTGKMSSFLQRCFAV